MKFVEENIDLIQDKTLSRGIKLDFSSFKKLFRERKNLLKEVENLRASQNQASKWIGELKQQGKDASPQIAEMKKIAQNIKQQEKPLNEVEEKLRTFLLNIPNLPHESVPIGQDAEQNTIVRTVGQKPEKAFDPKPHWEIGKNLGILDFERAAKIAGARFAVYLGVGALLERALINFMLDIHTREKGYREVVPPFIANSKSLTGTGNLPKFEEDLFKLEDRDWYMIPTAEVPLTNLFREEILEGEGLPLRFVAYTPCFRQEAGSYGKDVRGLIRLHQFNKVELMSFVKPEESYQELEQMTSDAEEVLKRLELPYRVVVLCTADMGFSGAKTYDLELWMPHRKKYLEISSCTNCEDFQARRADIRFRRNADAKPEFVHTLNGSGVAIGRTVSAILEIYQEKDGTVIIPDALRPYLNGLEQITPEPF